MSADRLMTMADVAQYANVTGEAVWLWHKHGWLRPDEVTWGGRRLYRMTTVVALLRARKGRERLPAGGPPA